MKSGKEGRKEGSILRRCRLRSSSVLGSPSSLSLVRSRVPRSHVQVLFLHSTRLDSVVGLIIESAALKDTFLPISSPLLNITSSTAFCSYAAAGDRGAYSHLHLHRHPITNRQKLPFICSLAYPSAAAHHHSLKKEEKKSEATHYKSGENEVGAHRSGCCIITCRCLRRRRRRRWK